MKATNSLKVGGWKQTHHADSSHEGTGMARVTADKIDLKIKNVTRYRVRHFLKTKGPTHQEDTMIINICAPNDRPSTKHTKQNLTETKKQTIQQS